MTKNKIFPAKKILFLVVVLFAFISALDIAFYFPPFKNSPPVAIKPSIAPESAPTGSPTPEPTLSPLPILDMNIANWTVYRNEEIGIEFKYPSALGEATAKKTDHTNADIVYSGSRIDIYFTNIDNNWFSFTAYTSDYNSFMDFFMFKGSDDINKECPNPLKYGDYGEACKTLEINGSKAIWKNYFIGYECSPSFGSQIYFNNESLSIYKGLSFDLYLYDAGKKVNDLYNCADDIQMEKADAEATVQSKNIMEKKNLSENDLEKINLIEQILSTFKFAE